MYSFSVKPVDTNCNLVNKVWFAPVVELTGNVCYVLYESGCQTDCLIILIVHTYEFK